MRAPLGVAKLIVDSCSKGNVGIVEAGRILRDHQGDILAAFGSFLGCQLIIYTELMAVCEGLELVTQLRYSVLKVESHSATVVSWIHSQGPVRWDYIYLLCRVCDLISSSHILIRHVLRTLHLLLIFWPIGLALTGLAGISCVLRIFLRAYLAFFI